MICSSARSVRRYLDITEAIEEGDAHTGLDNSDFVDTEIPFEFVIPEKNYLEDAAREKARASARVPPCSRARCAARRSDSHIASVWARMPALFSPACVPACHSPRAPTSPASRVRCPRFAFAPWLCLAPGAAEQVRDFVLELSMNASVEQRLPAHEISAIFREAETARETLLADAVNGDRGRRQQPTYVPSDGDMDAMLRAAIAQI
jgi:hypothetical protein